MKSIRSPGIVVRRTDYSEADRIVQFITPLQGKVSVIAKGVRKQKSKLAGGIELFAVSDITYMSGKGNLATLTGARMEVFYRTIMTDYDRLSFGYEAVKQIARAADSLDEPAFFELLKQTYQALDTIAIPLPVIRMWFWLQLGILLGLGLNLSTDDNGDPLREDARYSYDESQGVFSRAEQGTYTSTHIKFLRVASAKNPTVIAQIGGIEAIIDDCLWVAERSFAH